MSSIVRMLARARTQGAKRPTPTQSTCLYYDHDSEASKCVMNKENLARLPQKSRSFLASIAFGVRPIRSVKFWTPSHPERQSTAVHGPFTPAVLIVLMPLLLSNHGICRAGQDAHMNLVVVYCCTKSCFVFRAWMSIIILNSPVFHLCFNLCFR